MNDGKKKMEIKFLRLGMKEPYFKQICSYFGWNVRLTVNGHADVEVREKDMEMFEETARRGFFSIIKRH